MSTTSARGVAASSTTEVRPSRARYLVIGGLGGLTWATALRGWMVQLAGVESRFTWLTFPLLLLPGVVVGVLLGRAAHDRVSGAPSPRWLVFAPVALAAAVADPQIFSGLIHSGVGGGWLGVVMTALAAGHALSRRSWSITRVATALMAVIGLLGVALMGSMAGPLTGPRGAWVSLLGCVLLLILCLGSALPYSSTRIPHRRTALVALGALCGLAWAASLRVFMAEIAGRESQVHWGETFGYILLPGVVAGGVLAWAESERRRGRRRSWAALAPLVFTAVLVTHFWQLPSLARDGIGGGAIGVPVVGMLGGWAVARRGRPLGRAVSGVLFVAGLVVWAFTATTVGGPTFALDTPHGLWATSLYYCLLITLALAASVPHRAPEPVHTDPRAGSLPAAVASVIVASVGISGCTSTASEPTAAESDAAVVSPVDVWPLDGDGDAAVGSTKLVFDGGHELAAEAITFDGASGFARTNGPGPIDTTKSYSVAAWVSLASPKQVGGAEFATAVSQLGDEAAAFYLGVAEGVWSFSVKDADTNEPGHTIRASSTPATPDPKSWLHLVGVYDQAAEQIRLYVNGAARGEAEFPANPWRAQGPLTIAAAQSNRTMSDFWPGAVADVQVFPTALGDGNVRALAEHGRPTSPPPLSSTGSSAARLPDGTYEYILTREEARQIESCCFSPEEAAAAGGFQGRVGVDFRVEDDQWQLFFTFDGRPFTVNGELEGDGGTYTLHGNRLVTSNGDVEVTYHWSLKHNVLSLELLEDSEGMEDADIVRLNTEHDYILIQH